MTDKRTDNSFLFFKKQGNGNRSLLLFHGFGQSHTAFNQVVTALSTQFTCYSFDLYFHGASHWTKDEEPLEKAEWRKDMESFLAENNIDHFSLLGYSMGGKFALATLEAFPTRVKDIFLVAADGIHKSLWYRLATYPMLLRKLFKTMISHHDRFITVARTAHTIGLLNKSLLRFAESQMDTADKREKVYYTWVVFRHLSFDMDKIAGIINEQRIHLVVIAGKHDKVVRPQHMTPLLDRVKHFQLEILDAGHNHLLEEKTGAIIAALTSTSSALK